VNGPLLTRQTNRRPQLQSPDSGTLLVCVGVAVASACAGIVVTRLPAFPLSLSSETVGFSLIALVSLVIVLVSRRPSVCFLIVFGAAFLGTRHHLSGQTIDTRDFSVPLAAAFLIRSLIAGSIRIRPALRPIVAVGLTAWLLVAAGTVIAQILTSGTVKPILNWLTVLLLGCACMCALIQMSPDSTLGVVTIVAMGVALGALGQLFGIHGSPVPYTPDSFDTSRYDSFFGHPNSLATFMALAAILTTALVALPSARRAWRVLAAGAIPLELTALVLTASRGGIGAASVAVAVPLLITVWFGGSLAPRQRRAALIVGTGLGVVALVVAVGFGSGLATRLGDTQSSGDDARFQAIQEGTQLALSYPLLGVGVGNYETGVQSRLHFPIELQHAHNTFLTVWDERGLLGLLGLLTFVALPPTALGLAYRRRHVTFSQLLLGVGLPLVVAFHGSVEYLFEELQGQEAVVMSLLVGACAIVGTATYPRPADRPVSDSRPSTTRRSYV
jgi:O-antigen ligase